MFDFLYWGRGGWGVRVVGSEGGGLVLECVWGVLVWVTVSVSVRVRGRVIVSVRVFKLVGELGQ